MKVIFSILVLLFTSFCFGASNGENNQRLVDQLNKEIKKSRVAKEHLGLNIALVNDHGVTTVYDVNSFKKFIPASLTKLPTALAAFHYLGPEHKFLTTLESDGSVVKGVLNGNLYLVGHGDPTFTSESLWSLVNEFKRENITQIARDIVVDDTFFDSVRYDKLRDPHRKDRAYDAPIGAMSFNWNSVNIFVRPSKKGKSPQVYIDPTAGYFKLVNKAKTISGRRQRLRISRVVNPQEGKFPFETIIVSGTIGDRAKEYVSYKSITRPDIWSGHNLKSFLQDRGIEVLGQVKVGKKPSKTIVRADFESEPVGHAIKSMNKYSNNFVAEMLIKNIAAKYKQPGTMSLGLEKVNEFLLARGFLKTNFQYQNASGLTTNNFFRPYDFTRLLVGSQKETLVYPEFLTSLPISAVDGTLKTRMTSLYSAKKVRAKTGMLNKVSGLAGYIDSHAGNYVFTFLYNGPSRKNKNARDLFDYLTEKIVTHSQRKL